MAKVKNHAPADPAAEGSAPAAAGKQKRFPVGLLVLLILIFVLTSGFLSYKMLTGPKAPTDKSYVAVTIPSGASTAQIGSQLEKEGIIVSGLAFNLYSRTHDLSSQYKAGTYSLQRSMNVAKIAQTMAEGKTDNEKFTVIAGNHEYEIGASLAKAGMVDEAKFKKVIETTDFTEKYDFLQDAQKNKHILEGYLYPDTYELPLGSSEKQVVEKMLDGFQSVFTDDLKARAQKRGMTINQVVIVASIIEREAGIDDDRAKIASVIYNRLNKKMALQMDSTVAYAMSVDGNEKKADLSNADTRYDSPYNTYLNKGLPPGPICSPSLKSIQAALYPAKTDYLYFVLSARLDGSCVFSKTSAQFSKDVAAYDKAKKAQQAKQANQN